MALEKNEAIKINLSKNELMSSGGDIPNNITPPEAANGFSQRLRLAMKSAGVTQKELAERAGVSQNVISRLVNGKDKSGTRSGVLSHALGVDLNWLHYGSGEMQSDNFSIKNCGA